MDFAACALGALILLALAVMGWDVRARRRERAELRGELRELRQVLVGEHQAAEDGRVLSAALVKATRAQEEADRRAPPAPIGQRLVHVDGVHTRDTMLGQPPAEVLEEQLEEARDRGDEPAWAGPRSAGCYPVVRLLGQLGNDIERKSPEPA